MRWSVVRENEGHARRIWLLKKEMRLFGVAGILIGYFTLAWAPYITFEFVSIIKEEDLDRYIRYDTKVFSRHSNGNYFSTSKKSLTLKSNSELFPVILMEDLSSLIFTETVKQGTNCQTHDKSNHTNGYS